MIEIKQSKIADTRTCDFTKVTEEDLWEASNQHINDVEKGMLLFINMLSQASLYHDFTKLTRFSVFHSDFLTGFKDHNWWDMHRKEERHHLSVSDGVRDDVDLIDVLEYITDCVMAGMARTGRVTPIDLSNEVLQKAFQNTVELLKSNVRVVD